MRRSGKRWSLLVLCLSVLALVTFLPGLPWSRSLRHTLKRIIVKAEMRLAKWQGNEPRIMSIVGQVNEPGAEVQTLDSRSGWATLADREGHFVLPDVMWYPRAVYELVISNDDSTGRLIKVRAPGEYPENGVFSIGELNTNLGSEVELGSLSGVNSITREDFDFANSEYYKDVFDKVSAARRSDEEKIGAILDYVAGKLNYEETQVELGSPRRVLERGSQYCGHLSAALETLLKTGGYRTRAIDLSSGEISPATHEVVEVFYGEGWHLYDPTVGLNFRNKDGNVASYRETRLDPSLISEDLFRRSDSRVPRQFLAQLPAIYGTGYHHFYYFKN